MMKKYCFVCGFFILITMMTGLFAAETGQDQIPMIVVTDLYHPHQDRGDNFDLIMGYALPEVDLKGVILDITDAFRKKTADHPTLWKDPDGPREGGFIPVMQLNAIFNVDVPCGMAPTSMMRSEEDTMEDSPPIEQKGIDLILKILAESDRPVEILSFGSARPLAVAYNRAPELFRTKIARIHLSAGTTMPDFSPVANVYSEMIPGASWNVALDPLAFTRLLRSDLPIAIYPCAGSNGAFAKYQTNTYWEMNDLGFIRNMDPRLGRYIDFAFTRKLAHDFLRLMDDPDNEIQPENYPLPFHVWETPVWISATGRELVQRSDGGFRILTKEVISGSDRIIPYQLLPCELTVRDNGRFTFKETEKPTNFSIYFRPDPDLQEKALQEAMPRLYESFRP